MSCTVLQKYVFGKLSDNFLIRRKIILLQSYWNMHELIRFLEKYAYMLRKVIEWNRRKMKS